MPKTTFSPDDKIIFVTRDGLKKLQEELDYLKDVRRKEVVERIKEAISYGDLSENAEYEDAKNEQAFVEGRILELEEKMKNAKIIEEKAKGIKKAEVVQLGTKVFVRRTKSKKDEPEEYIIVGSTEANSLERKISNVSPLGQALLGKKSGNIVKVNAPMGVVEYEILKLS